MRAITSICRGLRWLMLIAAVVGLVPAVADAKALTVTKTTDSNDHACTPKRCSLRDAVLYSRAGDTVVVPGRRAHYAVTLGEIPIDHVLKIVGAGASKSIIDAGGRSRVFHVTAVPAANSTITIQGVTITGGRATTMPGGGGILVDLASFTVRVNLALVNSVVKGNRAKVSTGQVCCGGGGGIYSGGGDISLLRSSVDRNTVVVKGSKTSGVPAAGTDGGGGIYQAYGAVTVISSTVNSNSATVTGYYPWHGGGGIYDDGGAMKILGSQVSHNSFSLNGTRTSVQASNGLNNCCSGGGGVYDNSDRSLTIKASALLGNTATITSGQCCHGGGAVYVDTGAPLAITSSSLSGNSATVNGDQSPAPPGSHNTCCAGGGAVATFGPITLTRSTLDRNKTTIIADQCCNGGGAIQFDTGSAGHPAPLAAIASVISRNGATFLGAVPGLSGGGGVFFDSAGADTFVNSTISDNRTNASGRGRGGGGLYILATPSIQPETLANATIAGNSDTSGAGGGVLIDGPATLKTQNTIVALNHAAKGANCFGLLDGRTPVFASLGYNLEDRPGTCAFHAKGDRVVKASALKLGPLTSNGGPTMTRALLRGSPAINAGNPAGCTDAAGKPLHTDQRGFRRPSGNRCDIGAFEFQF